MKVLRNFTEAQRGLVRIIALTLQNIPCCPMSRRTRRMTVNNALFSAAVRRCSVSVALRGASAWQTPVRRGQMHIAGLRAREWTWPVPPRRYGRKSLSAFGTKARTSPSLNHSNDARYFLHARTAIRCIIPESP
jgi:hypothetical protein